MLPATIARYQIIAELGQGGMATVYCAYDPHTARKVAFSARPGLSPHSTTLPLCRMVYPALG